MTQQERDHYYRTNAPLSAYTWDDQGEPRYAPDRTPRHVTPVQATEPWPDYIPPYDKPRRRVFLWALLGCVAVIVITAAAAYLSTVKHSPSTSTAPANANSLVCQHYKTQRAWVKGLAKPTLADAVKFSTWVAADAAESTGTLHTNFAAMSADEQQQKSSYVASEKVIASCQALGVTF